MCIQKNIESLILLIALGLTWGSGFSIAHFAMTHNVPPLGYALWQTLGPAVILMIVGKCCHLAFTFDKKHNVFYAITGLFGIAIPNSMMYFSSQLIPAGLLGVLVNVTPVFTYIFALILQVERWSWLRVMAVILCSIGLIYLFLLKTDLYMHGVTAKVIALALISPLCFAGTAVYSARYRPSGTSSVVLAQGMLMFAFLVLQPVIAMTHSYYFFSAPFERQDIVILLEIMLSSLGYFLFFRLLQLAGAVYYSLVSGVVAITSLMWGRLLFGETFDVKEIISIGLIVTSIIIVTIKHQKNKVTL